MIGGLQGEFGDLDIKYLKQNISKCRSQISGSFRRTPRHCAKWLQNFRSKRTTFSQLKVDFAAVQHSAFSLEWSACNGCNSFISTPNCAPFKHWIVDFLIFEKKYSMHKFDFRKCSKSGWHDCHQEYASWQISLCFFSLHSGFTHGSKGLHTFSHSLCLSLSQISQLSSLIPSSHYTYC